ncbi:MAG: iron-containing redox enzyme family protein [Chthonomonas sp.]|nr:iron-containing redox enzyme family protein [Chthonomonas sp.]
MTDRIAELDAIVAQYNLNNHPFYQAWRAGELPQEKLADYAAEYGKFVATIDQGWETIGYGKYAQEEREHVVLWGQFKQALGNPKSSNRPQTDVLVTAASKLFVGDAEAVGALYAFEAQQPFTSQSKLDGLNEHYKFTDTEKEYFTVHAADVNEIADLRNHVQKLSDEEYLRARGACAVVCSAMWSALDGVYYA